MTDCCDEWFTDASHVGRTDVQTDGRGVSKRRFTRDGRRLCRLRFVCVCGSDKTSKFVLFGWKTYIRLVLRR